MNQHPLTSVLDTLPSQIASLPPSTIASKLKGYAIQAALAGTFALLRWGYKKGTFKPTKYTIPIYAGTGAAVIFYLWKYRQEAQTIIAKAQEGLTSPSSTTA